MRHYMVDPDNEERLLKVPPQVVKRIKAEAYAECIKAVEAVRNSDEHVQNESFLILEALRALGDSDE